MGHSALRLGLWALIACTSASPLRSADAGAAADLDAKAAMALAETVPLLTLNLNNYKHPANPVLTAGEQGQWDAAGIERVAVIRVGRDDWRMWYACTGQRRSIGLATSKDGVHWTKHLGNPVLVSTEPWEDGHISPTSVLQVNGRFYLYYATGQQSLGLIRAPKRSLHQPIVLWEKQVVEPVGLQSMILEPDRLPFTLHLTSDQDGELRLVAWNPAARDWLELAPASVHGGVLYSIAPLPAHAKLRLKFTPREGRATVSAWLVPQ